MSSKVSLKVVSRNGGENAIVGQVGDSLMEAIRACDLEEIFAICGGCCSCATCHVYVDPLHAEGLPAIGSNEDDLLACSRHRTARSRLSCQIRLTPELDGLRVEIAPLE
jgi:2Fe-2S ferredoxin